jgi:hypothetical protein
VQFLVACASVCVCVCGGAKDYGVIVLSGNYRYVESVTRCCAVHGGGLVTCALEFVLLGTNRGK